MFCKKCGYQLKDGALFCKKCGCKVGAPSDAEFVALFCEECGNKLREGALFCKKCGHSVAAELPAAEETKVEVNPAPAAEEIKPEPVAIETPKPVAVETKPAPIAEEIKPVPAAEKIEEPEPIDPNVCTHCGSTIEDGSMFCKACGYKREKPRELCPNCGADLSGSLLFCRKCGAKVEKKDPAESKPAYKPAPYTMRWHDEEEQKYGAPAPAAPQKQTKWQKAPTWQKVGTIVSFSLLAGILVYVFFGIVLRRSDEPYAPSDSYSSSSKSSTSTGGGYTANVWDLGTSSDNAGHSDYTHTEPVKQQKFTSPKTGTTFTIPEQGHAVLARGGTVSASYQTREPIKDSPHDSIFFVNNREVEFHIISPSGGWKAGSKFGYSELCSDGSDNYIKLDYPFVYAGKTFNGLFSSVYPEYFNDAAFEVIEASGNNVVFWFYAQYKVSGSGEFYTIEGVGNVVLGGSSGGSSGGNTGGSWDIGTDTSGGMTCGVCIGSGMVNCSGCVDGYNSCPNCNGSGTYYVWGEGHSTWCTRCNGGGKIQCSRCFGSGKVTCISCGGDGKI